MTKRSPVVHVPWMPFPFVVLVLLVACGGHVVDSAPSDAANDSGTAKDSTAPTDATSVDASPTDVTLPPPGKVSCNDDPPPGAKAPPPLPTYAGACPTLVAAPADNTLVSSGGNRVFKLAVPKGLDPKEKLPVIFLWHWLGGDAKGFYETGDIQNAVDTQRFLAIIPEAKRDSAGKKAYQFMWPATLIDPESAVTEELQFMDDMLACVAKQFPTVNPSCISSGGVSAGALWTDQLAWRKSAMLSSFISLSGGVDTAFAKGWGKTDRKLPGLVLWGGPSDGCLGLVSFEKASQSLEGSMVTDGNFLVECIHNCGHAQPPVDPPPGYSTFSGIWAFAFDHPYWLGTGESPYKASGLPKSLPAWCGIGRGSATPRTGTCATPSAC